MSHFLKDPYVRTLTRDHAMVEVELAGKSRLEIKGIAVAKAGTTWTRLPEIMQISGAGEVVTPSKQFWVSVETINPWHGIIDAGQDLFR